MTASPHGPAKPARLIFCLSVLLGASIGLNCLSFWRAHSWRLKAEQRITDPTPRAADSLAVGTVLPPLRGKHLDGSVAVVDYRASRMPTLLYVMSPQCGWCVRNRTNFQAMMSQIEGRFRLVCVSLSTEGLAEYVAANHLNVPQVELLVEVPQSVLAAHKLTATPQTLVVSPEGRLLKLWRGAFTRDKQREVEDFLGVHLPGLTD